MNRNYRHNLRIDSNWSDSRETHPAVAQAIHAIASGNRTPDLIWSDPTPNEYDHVVCAVQEYVTHGDFPAEPDGRYPWGAEAMVIEVTAAIEVGMTVEAGKVGTEDHDTGRVLEIEGEMALVAWQSGVRTWSPIEDLSEVD